MATHTWDVGGEAREALDAVVKDYGPPALSNAQILNSLLKDLLPDSPLQSSVLVAAAEADVPGMLKDRVAQHISTAAAIAQAAATLEERTALAPDACQWAARELAEVLGLIQEPETSKPPQKSERKPDPKPTPKPDPKPTPKPDPTPVPTSMRKPASAAVVAAWAALVCAVSISGQVLAHTQLGAPYAWQIALTALVLTGAAVLTFRGHTKYIGAGLIFGAALAAIPNFIEGSFVSGLGGAFVAASVLTTLAALVAAGSSAVYLSSEMRQGRANLRNPLVAVFCLAALGVVIAAIPGDQKERFGGSWLTLIGELGSGVHGKFIFAGLVAIAALAIPVLIAGLLNPGTGVRAGVVMGWLAVAGLSIFGSVLSALTPEFRAAPALYVSFVFWVITAALSVPLLAGDRRTAQARSAQPTIAS